MFFIPKISKPRHSYKFWLTYAMKESVQKKNNRLYFIHIKGNAPDNGNERYRAYRNILNLILLSVESKYHQELLVEHTANIKKASQIFKGIINKRNYPLYNTLFNTLHWGQDKMSAILQTTFSNRFYIMKMYEFRLTVHWCLFLSF